MKKRNTKNEKIFPFTATTRQGREEPLTSLHQGGMEKRLRR